MPRKKREDPTNNTEPMFVQDNSMLQPRATEQLMANIQRMLSEQEFESIDEANAFLQEMMNSGQLNTLASTAETPLDQAQEIMYEAWNAPTKRKRVELARRALEISPDCADAYVLLAQESTRSTKKAKELYEQGVQAGERVLGPEAFEEDVGHFWGLIETRPYMRARSGLAQTLWAMGEHQQAIEHFTDMLRLNPGDNQGIRYLLASCLLATGDDERLGELLDQYSEDASARWMYTRALWLFRREGAGRKANTALRKALEMNPFVPEYLFGITPLPEQLPPYVGLGDETEAIDYAIEGIENWFHTPGAMQWFASRLEHEIAKIERNERRR